MKQIGFFQTAFLGDVLHCLPAVQAIKEKNPSSRTTFVTRRPWGPLLECYQDVDHAVEISKSDYRRPWKWKELHLQLPLPLDHFITAHKSTSSLLFNLSVPARKKSAFFTHPLSLLFHHHTPYDRRISEWQRVWRLALSAEPPPYWNSTLRLRPWSDELLQWHHTLSLPPFVVIAPGSHWPTKRWPPERFLELARWIEQQGMRVVWTGVSQEIDQPQLFSTLGHNFIDRTTLPQWLLLLTQAKMIIALDSAASHLGMLHRIPTMTLFGPTAPGFGWSPRQPEMHSLGLDLPCRPCTDHGAQTCPLHHHHCMKNLEASSVLLELHRVFKRVEVPAEPPCQSLSPKP